MKIFIDFILVTGLTITVLVLFLLLKANKKQLHKKVLLVFFVYILFINLHAYACLHNLVFLYKISFFFDFTIIFLFAPLLLLYVRSVFEVDKEVLKKTLVHFIPCILITLGLGIPFLMMVLIETFQPKFLVAIDENQFWIVIVRNLYFLAYVFLSLNTFKKYQRAMKCQYSNLSLKDFRWVQKLLYGCAVFISVDIITRILDVLEIDFVFDIGYLTMFSIILFTGYIGYYGVSQSKILLPDFLIADISSKPEENKRVNNLSNYNQDDISLLINNLEKVIVENKLYLDEDLNLNVLSEKLNLTSKKLSTLLNSYMNTTFYEYINSFRIDAVKKMLLSENYENYTFLGMAHECGFNSKASFNRIFKKETGLSPSQFRRQQLQVNFLSECDSLEAMSRL
jgi:AraC-like DNA-binding protein